MVCFSRFVYHVKAQDVPTFSANTNKFFKGVNWVVSRGDLSVTTSDVQYALNKLANETGDYTFDTQRIWNNTSSSCCMPPVDWSRVTVTEAQRVKYTTPMKWTDDDGVLHTSSSMVDTVHNGVDSPGGCESYIEYTLRDLEFKDMLAVLKMVHLKEPLTGVYLCPSTEDVYFKRDHNSAMRIFKKKGEFKYTKGVDFQFDFDNGFIPGWSKDSIPQEFREDFAEWCSNGQRGEPLKVRYQ